MLYVVRGLYRLAQRYKRRKRSRQVEVRPENLFGVCAVPFVCLFLLNFAWVSKCLFWYAVNRQISLCVGGLYGIDLWSLDSHNSWLLMCKTIPFLNHFYKGVYCLLFQHSKWDHTWCHLWVTIFLNHLDTSQWLHAWHILLTSHMIYYGTLPTILYFMFTEHLYIHLKSWPKGQSVLRMKIHLVFLICHL